MAGMTETEKNTLRLRAKQLAGDYVVAAALRAGEETPAFVAVDLLVARIQQAMEEAYFLGALGPDRVPVRVTLSGRGREEA